jgi:DNA primase
MSSLPQAEETRTRRYRGVSYTRPIDAAKEAVPVIDLADRLLGPSGLRRIGQEWAGRCPLPDHTDRSPSFTVNSEKNVWFCHGCLRGGDVVELARLAWDHGQHEVAMTAAQVLAEFGHEMPPRPASWHRRQSRQELARRALKDALARRVQRRLYRWILAPGLANIADENERREEAGYAWEDAGKIARQIVARAGGA